MDATPWPEVADLLDYWAENRPLQRLLQDFMAFMGYEAKPIEEVEEDARPMTYEEAQSWVAGLNRR